MGWLASRDIAVRGIRRGAGLERRFLEAATG